MEANVLKCKKEYIINGFICFTPEVDYTFEISRWGSRIFNCNYKLGTVINDVELLEYFYTPKEVLIKQRKEKIEKLLNKDSNG